MVYKYVSLLKIYFIFCICNYCKPWSKSVLGPCLFLRILEARRRRHFAKSPDHKIFMLWLGRKGLTLREGAILQAGLSGKNCHKSCDFKWLVMVPLESERHAFLGVVSLSLEGWGKRLYFLFTIKNVENLSFF